jgi:hypothetical protein
MVTRQTRESESAMTRTSFQWRSGKVTQTLKKKAAVLRTMSAG